MISGRTLLCCPLALSYCATATAQEAPRRIQEDYLIKRWEMEHGLPENSATAFAQTADGYLWFGTFKGLVRFDGVEFKVFGPEEIPAMRSPSVVNLFLDIRQRMWVSTYEGMLLREGDDWRLIGPEQGWTGDFARSFAGRPDGEVLITDFKGRIFESAGNGVRELTPPDTLEKGQGCIAGVDDEGMWWVVQNRFIGRRENDRWVEKFPRSDLGGSDVGCGPAHGGGIWLKTGRELRRFQRGAETERREIPEDTGGLWSMMEDSRRCVWVASYHMGLSRIAPDGSLSRWDEARGGGDRGRSVFEDREGNLWFGTSGDGLARASLQRFRTVKPGGTQRAIQVTSVARQAAGGFWVATAGSGLWQLGENGRLSRVELPDPARTTAYLMSTLEDRRGAVWLGTAEHGLHRWIDGALEAFPPQLTGGGTSRALFEDSKGRIWSGGGSGLGCFENENWRTVDARGNAEPFTVLAVAEDAESSIWVAHNRGLFRSSDGANFAAVEDAGSAITRITGLWADAGGVMWLGSDGQGLLRWQAGRADRVPDFPVAKVDDLFADGQGNLWATAGHRLIRAPLTVLHAAAAGQGRLAVQVFGPADGLRAKQFSAGEQPAVAQDAAGRLCFATVIGAVVADPAALRLNPLPPPAQVTRLNWHREGRGAELRSTEDKRDGPFSAPVMLPPGSRNIEIHYAALSLTAPEKNQYQVRLDGVDSRWIDYGARRMAYFHELEPGDYVFRVRGSNNDGVWNETAAAVSFRVQPYYWQTAWFRLLMITAAAGMIAGVLFLAQRERRRRRAERSASARELQQLRDELAHLTRVALLGELSGSLAHELNQPLAAVLSNAQAGLRFLVRGNPDMEEMQALLQDIAADAKRAGGIIHGMRAMFKKETRQELQPVDIDEVVEQVRELLHAEIVSRQAEVDFNTGGPLPPVRAGRVELTQVLINLLLNSFDAMKEWPAPRRVQIVTALASGHVSIRVRDHGPGIAPEVRGKLFTPFASTKSGGLGMGLAISRTIVERFGGRLTAENHPEGGAEFSITLPPAPANEPLQPEAPATS
jgi:signal transduction histidine kinase/ligand-binding sensor domain-containing protein